MQKKYFQVFITDDIRFTKFILHNNYVKYLIFISDNTIKKDEFFNFNYSNNASTNKYKVFINTQTVEDKFNENTFHPSKNIDLLSDNNNVNIIIPSWNNTKLLLKCLKLIIWYKSPAYNINLIVVDNGSTEETLNALEKFCKEYKKEQEIIVLKQEKNIGYTLAMNLGIQYAKEHFSASYTILMHNDVEVSPGWMDYLLKPIKDNTVGTVPITSDTSVDQGFKHIKETKLLDNFPESFYRLKTADTAKLLNDLYKDTLIDIDPRIFKPKMFCIALNTLLFDKIGTFDPIFLDGLSADDDFITRLYLAGYNLKLVPAVPVKHDSGTSYRVWNHNWHDLKNLYDARQLQYKLTNTLNIAKNKETVIYTVILGENAQFNLKLASTDTNKYDYICFIDNDNIKIPKPWIPINIKALFRLTSMQEYNEEIFKFWLKTHPFMYLRNYKYSVYIDSSLAFINLYNYIETFKENKSVVFAVKDKKYISTNQYVVEKLKTLSEEEQNKLTKFYNMIIEDNYPDNFGIYKIDLLMHQHNTEEFKKFMSIYWKFIIKNQVDPVLTFMYLSWKENIFKIGK